VLSGGPTVAHDGQCLASSPSRRGQYFRDRLLKRLYAGTFCVEGLSGKAIGIDLREPQVIQFDKKSG
jgi:hypothetical protein